MTDFLITMVTLYPWFAWLLAVLAVIGMWSVGIVVFVLAWARFRGAAGDDPPEYQHPDGDEDELADWDGPPDDWSPAAEWGPQSWRSLGTLAEIVAALDRMSDDDQLPDGPPVDPGPGGARGPVASQPGIAVASAASLTREATAGNDSGSSLPGRCNNADCFKYGQEHPGACDVAPTQPAACYTDPAGPAGPPVPWSNFEAAFPLHAAIRSDLEAAGFGGHEYTEDVAASAFTAAEAREVQAMITDGVITREGQGNGQDH